MNKRFIRGYRFAHGMLTLLSITMFPAIAHAYSCATIGFSNDGCVQGNFVLDIPANIASDAPFGISDWVPLDTSNDGTDDAVVGIALFTADTGIPNVGAWQIQSGATNPWDRFDDLMITLEGVPGDYVAYSLQPGVVSGYYFISSAEPALSHARLWATTSAVPLPTSVWLFGSGLIGLAAVARRHSFI